MADTKKNQSNQQDGISRRDVVTKMAATPLAIAGAGSMLASCATSAQEPADFSLTATRVMTEDQAEARKVLLERIINARYEMESDDDGNLYIDLGESVFPNDLAHENWLFHVAGRNLEDHTRHQKAALSLPAGNGHPGATPADPQSDDIQAIITTSKPGRLDIWNKRVAGVQGQPDINEGDDVYHLLKAKIRRIEAGSELEGFVGCLQVLVDAGVIEADVGDDAIVAAYAVIEDNIAEGEKWAPWHDDYATIDDLVGMLSASGTVTHHNDY